MAMVYGSRGVIVVLAQAPKGEEKMLSLGRSYPESECITPKPAGCTGLRRKLAVDGQLRVGVVNCGPARAVRFGAVQCICVLWIRD